MRVVVGAIIQESNHFTPGLCSLDQFRASYLYYGDEVIRRLKGTRLEVAGFLDAADAANVTVVPTIAAHSVSYGPLSSETFAHLKEELLRRISEAGPVDGVLLAQHGAMAVEDDDDPEGTILEAVRTIVGPVPVATTFDMHAHVTEKQVLNADIIIGYSHYPHDDTYETGTAAATLLFRCIRGEIKPVVRFAKAPLIIPANNQQTAFGPMHEIMKSAKKLEADGTALSASYFGVQPWLDVPDMGFTAVVVADGDSERAYLEAKGLAAQAWELRDEFTVELVPPETAVSKALASSGKPFVLCETADAPGGGGTGDSTELLEALLAAVLTEPAVMNIVDPVAVGLAIAAGVGETVTLTVGNRIDTARGEPLEVTGLVHLISDGRFVYRAGLLAGVTGNMGPSVVLHVGSIELLISTSSTYEWDDAQYRSVGIDVRQAKIVGVRMPVNFKFSYQNIMSDYMILDTQGVTTANLRSLRFQRISRPVYPLDDDFIAEIR